MRSWQNWDAVRLADIAQYGYFSPAEQLYPDQIAFFPGFPAALDVVHAIVRQWTVSGLIVSFVAGAVAVVALSRIAELRLPARLGQPGGAVPRGLAGRDLPGGRVHRGAVPGPGGCELAVRCAATAGSIAVLLAGLASVVRVNGLFLCAAVAFEILRRAGARPAASAGHVHPGAGTARLLRDLPAGAHRQLAGLDARRAGSAGSAS